MTPEEIVKFELATGEIVVYRLNANSSVKSREIFKV
jgi:bisphosphoglycerate-dependent phosphoglycerate mutase